MSTFKVQKNKKSTKAHIFHHSLLLCKKFFVHKHDGIPFSSFAAEKMLLKNVAHTSSR